MQTWRLPEGLIGRFAVVKLWPDIQAAEDEIIQRFRVSANELGLECVIIDERGKIIGSNAPPIGPNDVDFVIHTHFATPKLYNAFSFVVLWNPTQFYHDWGYQKYSGHLLTHDDVLNSNSPETVAHFERMIYKSLAHLNPEIILYPSVSSPIIEPKISDNPTLFYCGINWERLGEKKGRFHDLLKNFDGTGDLKIYGPDIFHGVKVWKNFNSYQHQIPFDGKSIIEKISEAGVALVFSSEAHIQSAVISNRLFESLAAGAVIIADEHPFVRKHFGDSLLYVNSKSDLDELTLHIQGHLNWVRENPNEALQKAKQAQNIFKEKYTLDVSLCNLYEKFSWRKSEIDKINLPNNQDKKVDLFALMPELDKKALYNLADMLSIQTYKNFNAYVLIDEEELDGIGKKERELFNGFENIELVGLKIYQRGSQNKKVGRRNIGEILHEALLKFKSDLFMTWSKNETILSDHISNLVHAFSKNSNAHFSYSNIVYCYDTEKNPHYDLSEELMIFDFYHRPIGCSRFIFQNTDHVNIEHLKYMDWNFNSLLVAGVDGVSTDKSTCLCDAHNIPYGHDAISLKNLEVVFDIYPKLRKSVLIEKMLSATAVTQETDFSRLSRKERINLIKALVEVLPIPFTVKNFAKKAYRFMSRKTR